MFMLTVQNMKVSGLRINNRELVVNGGRTTANMRGST